MKLYISAKTNHELDLRGVGFSMLNQRPALGNLWFNSETSSHPRPPSIHTHIRVTSSHDYMTQKLMGIHALRVGLVRTTEGTRIHLSNQAMFLRFLLRDNDTYKNNNGITTLNELRDLHVRGTTSDTRHARVHQLQVRKKASKHKAWHSRM